ncbi:hypothetical protein BDN72DRAFT_891601 [Pluteus cervinus]|uniref:Uncharacterized protein n=1 Tax=Pluteus cervinus TaxID=181527 RepID=A0ACD3BHR0_9AGAR|nr:hypothetical protein BDN72DRAFT_891601 [Pluteus cervinus]
MPPTSQSSSALSGSATLTAGVAPAKSSSPTTSAPTTSPSPTASSSPFVFLNMPNVTMCQNMTISWRYTGLNDSLVTLTILRDDPTQPLASSEPPRLDPGAVGIRTLETYLHPNASAFMWAAVNLPPGSYRAIAETSPTAIPLAVSPLFFVQNSSDTSCLPNVTMTNHRNPPVLQTGDLVGIILGATAAIGVLVAAYYFPRTWRCFGRPAVKDMGQRPYSLY